MNPDYLRIENCSRRCDVYIHRILGTERRGVRVRRNSICQYCLRASQLLIKTILPLNPCWIFDIKMLVKRLPVIWSNPYSLKIFAITNNKVQKECIFNGSIILLGNSQKFQWIIKKNVFYLNLQSLDKKLLLNYLIYPIITGSPFRIYFVFHSFASKSYGAMICILCFEDKWQTHEDASPLLLFMCSAFIREFHKK